MTETQQRFLRAIAERVPKERVVEVHLFPAIRQGGVETGVAVVAEQPVVADAEPVASNGTAPEPSTDTPYIDPEFAPARTVSYRLALERDRTLLIYRRA